MNGKGLANYPRPTSNLYVSAGVVSHQFRELGRAGPTVSESSDQEDVVGSREWRSAGQNRIRAVEVFSTICLISDITIFVISVLYEAHRLFYVSIIFGTLYLAAQIYMWDFASALGLSSEKMSLRVKFLWTMDLDYYLRWMNAIICGLLIMIGLMMIRVMNNVFKGLNIDYTEPVRVLLTPDGFLVLFLLLFTVVLVYVLKWMYQSRVHGILSKAEYKDFIGYMNSFVMFSVIIGFGGRLLVSSFIFIYVTLILFTALYRVRRKGTFSMKGMRENLYKIRLTFFGIFHRRHSSPLARVLISQMFASAVILLVNVPFVNIYHISSITLIIPYLVIIISILTLYFNRFYRFAVIVTTAMLSLILLLFFFDFTYQPFLQFLVDDLESVGAIRLYPETEEAIMDTFSRLLIALYLITMLTTAIALLELDRSKDTDIIRGQTYSTFESIMISSYWMLIFGFVFIQIPPEYGIEMDHEWAMYVLIVIVFAVLVAILYVINVTSFAHEVRTGIGTRGDVDRRIRARLSRIDRKRRTMGWLHRNRTAVTLVVVSMLMLVAVAGNVIAEPSDTYLDGEGVFPYDEEIEFYPIRVDDWLEVDITIRNGTGSLTIILNRIVDDEVYLVWDEDGGNRFYKREALDDGVYALFINNSEVVDDPDDRFTLDMIVRRSADQLFALQPGFWVVMALYFYAIPPTMIYLRYLNIRRKGK